VGTVLLTVLLLLFGGGCAPREETPPLHRRLGLDWQPGGRWGVRVRVWPDRFSDPWAEGNESLQMTWRYRVARSDPRTGRHTVVQSDGRVAGRLLFSPDYNLLEVGVFRARTAPSTWQVQSIVVNSLGGRAMIQRRPLPNLPVFWFHPDLSVRGLDGSSRMNFDAGPGDWVTQTVRRPSADAYRILLRHAPTRTRVRFDWTRGEPWWTRAVWTRRRRVVAVAERVPPPDLSAAPSDTPPLRGP